MSKSIKTPMEKNQKFAHNLVASLRLQKTLDEFDNLTPEERAEPANVLMWEMLIKAIELAYSAENIEA